MKKIVIFTCIFFINLYAENLVKILEDTSNKKIVPEFIEKSNLFQFLYEFNYDNIPVKDKITIIRHRDDNQYCSIEFTLNNTIHHKYNYNKICTLSALRQHNNDTYIFLGDTKKRITSEQYISHLEVFKFDFISQKWYKYGTIEKDSSNALNDFPNKSYNIYQKPLEIKMITVVVKPILPTKQALYKKPNTKTKMYLIKGDKVEVLEEKDDWLYILYHGKKDIKAWIPKSAVETKEVK